MGVLRGFARFPKLNHLDAYTAFPRTYGDVDSTGLKAGRPHLDESAVEAVFRFINIKRVIHGRPVLQALDFKVGEWESLLNFDNTIGARKKHIFACRLVDGTENGLKTFFIPARKPLFNQHESYERALASVGLCDKLAAL
jgi:hypothetical protein